MYTGKTIAAKSQQVMGVPVAVSKLYFEKFPKKTVKMECFCDVVVSNNQKDTKEDLYIYISVNSI